MSCRLKINLVLSCLPFIVKPACDERDIVVTISARCMCECGFVRAKICIFVHGFQNYFALLSSSRIKLPFETFFMEVEGQGQGYT